MKIIHTGDIHLESKMHGLGTEKAKERQAEVRDAFFRLIDYAEAKSARVILIAGDFFDSKKVKLKTLKEVVSKIGLHPSIDFLYLNGNHDDSSVFSNEKLGELPSNLHIINSDNNSFRYDKVHIKAFDLTKLTSEELVSNLNFNPDDFNILMLHGMECEIPLASLVGKHIDYLALGDIHIPDIKAKKLDAKGVYGYSGVLEPRGFDELGERGFFLLEINKHELKRTFVSNNNRTYHIVNVDISGLDNYTLIQDAINKKVASISTDDIVRVVLIGSYNYDTIKDLDSILANLERKFYYAEVLDKSTLDYKTIDFEKEISLRGEFYNLVKNNPKLSEEEKEKILEYGLKALREEVIEI